MPTVERIMCRCGMGMMPTRGPGEGYYCPNCDQCQDQEAKFARRKTPQDVRFDMYWLRVINNEYKDNTEQVPEVGTTNEDEEETPPPAEGETT